MDLMKVLKQLKVSNKLYELAKLHESHGLQVSGRFFMVRIAGRGIIDLLTCQERHQAGMKELQTDHNRLIAQGRRATVQKEATARSYSLPYDGGTGNFQLSIFNYQLSVALALGALLLAPAPTWTQAGESPTRNDGPTARVVIVQDPQATDAFRARPERIPAMVNRAITNLTGRATAAEAWRSLVSTQEVVGIKVYSAPGPNSGTRPAVVAAVVEGLLAAGLPAKQIIVWDKQAADLRLAGFFELSKRYGIRVAGSAQAGYDEKAAPYESSLLGNLVWGDLEFGRTGEGLGRKSFLSKLVTREMTRIINLTPLLNHNLAGVSGNLFSLAMGSVDNTVRFESDASRLATAVPDIYNLHELSDRVVLNIVDALICQYEGGERGLLHYSAMLNQLRFSRDPVALDVLSIQELDHQRQAAKAPMVKPNLDLYNNASSLLELGISDLKKINVETLNHHE